MARLTVAQLEARLDEMQEEIDALRLHINTQLAIPAVQHVIELKRPEPLSKPLDVHGLMSGASAQYASYWEDADESRQGVAWNPSSGYL